MSTNSRICLEWAIPRDLRTYNPRLRSPLYSKLRNSSHESICEETPTSLSSAELSPGVRLVNIAVICRPLSMSIRRVTIDLTSEWEPTDAKFVIGSMTTTFGSNVVVMS